MNASEKPRRFGISSISSEALVGIGITLAEIGLLGLLLGWAEHMRGLPKFAFPWLAFGAVLVVVGVFISVSGRFKTAPRTRAEIVRDPMLPAEAETVSEAEEQRY